MSITASLTLTGIQIILMLMFVSSCTPGASFSKNTPVKLHPKESKVFSLNVSNWSDSHSLTLINGGPYVENSILLPVAIRYIQHQDQTIFAIDVNNDLRVVDFTQQPARQVLHAPMGDEVTAFAVKGENIFIALKNNGVYRLSVSGNSIIKKKRVFLAENVVQIKPGDKYIDVLAEKGSKIHRVDIRNSSNSGLTQSWVLPSGSSDFVMLDQFIILVSNEFGLGAVSQSDSRKLVSSLSLQGSMHQIMITGNTAFVADGSGGMVVVDIQDPSNMRWQGSHNKLGSIEKILISGDNAFVIDRDIRLSSINISSSELPITGSFYKPAGKINDAVLGGPGAPQRSAVYIATTSGIEKIIFTDKLHGQISNEGINQGGTRRAFIADNLAYVADWFSGLHIYDISRPDQVKHIGNMHTPGSSKGVVVENGYAYVGDDDFGLQIIDVSNPSRPEIVGSVLTTGLAYTLKKRGNLVFLADHRGGFHIIDVKDVKKPEIIASHNTSGKSWAIDVIGNTVYVADDTSGLLVFDISNIRQPRQVGQFDPSGQAEDVAVRDNIAYVSFFDKGLYLLDVSKPERPELLSHLHIPGNARSVVLQGRYAYIAGWESGLNVVDVSDVRAPEIVGRYDTRGSAWGADINGDVAYVWDWWGGVKVIDVSNPARPGLLSQYHAASKINRLRQKNNFIYTANHAAGVQVFDVNNVLNPIWSTGTDVDGHVLDVWPSDELALLFAVSDKEGLLAFDISDPFYISLAGMHPVPGTPGIVRESNGQVFVATTQGELHVFSVGENNSLTRTQTLILDINDMWIDGTTLYVASKAEGLLSLAIDENGHVYPRKKILTDKVFKVGASDKYIAAATDNFGIEIWQRTGNGIKSVSSININGTVLDLALYNNALFVLSNYHGLLEYEITGDREPALIARYPLTDEYSSMLLHNDAVFFAGQSSIASVQLLPKLQWMSVENNQAQVKVTGKLPVGNYHLAITDPGGHEKLWPNALAVELKTSGKPKLSIEDFQKLLEQHRKNQ